MNLLGSFIILYSHSKFNLINIDLEKLEKLSMDNGIKIYFKEYFEAQKVLDLGFGGFEEDEIEEAIKLFSQIWYKTKSN